MGAVDAGQAEIGGELAVVQQQRDAAIVAERLARHGGVIGQLLAHEFADQLVVRQFIRDVVAVGEFGRPATAMHHDHALEALIDLGVLDQAQPGGEAGAGAEQEQIAALAQIVDQQRAGRLAADQNLVALLEVLQARGQRAVGDLDAEEFQLVLIRRAGEGIGAHQRPALGLDAHHDELTAAEAETRRARRAETEQTVGPVTDADDALGVEIAHDGPIPTILIRRQKA